MLPLSPTFIAPSQPAATPCFGWVLSTTFTLVSIYWDWLPVKLGDLSAVLLTSFLETFQPRHLTSPILPLSTLNEQRLGRENLKTF